MSTGTHTSSQGSSGGNGQATPHDLFVLTDEQILEIEPEGESNVAPPFRAASSPINRPAEAAAQPVIPSESAKAGVARDRGNTDALASSQSGRRDSSSPSAPRNDSTDESVPAAALTSHDSPELPAWLAAQMKDPWSGEEARELWNGVQQARQEAAAYREAIPTPQDAHALKELYPGGIAEARAAAGRARLLEEIDGAYFGAAGKSSQEVSASRANLAQQLLREDPAAFREMVFTGLRALEEAEKGSGSSASASNLPRLAQIFAANRPDAQSAAGATQGSPVVRPGAAGTAPFLATETSAQRGHAGFQPDIPAAATSGPLAAPAASESAASVGAQRAAPQSGSMPAQGAHVAGYAAFEKAANDDLERSVGAAIERTLQQALPNLQHSGEKKGAGVRSTVPLRNRLATAVRQDVESALKGDRQLGEQIAQILSARRFDNETRTQVVRLIDDRARQLVPAAAKRVINDWTQTTLAAHRSSAARADAASSRTEVATAPVAPGNVAQGEPASPAAFSSGRNAASTGRQQNTRGASPHATTQPRRVDYHKLSDEQILEL